MAARFSLSHGGSRESSEGDFRTAALVASRCEDRRGGGRQSVVSLTSLRHPWLRSDRRLLPCAVPAPLGVDDAPNTLTPTTPHPQWHPGRATNLSRGREGVLGEARAARLVGPTGSHHPCSKALCITRSILTRPAPLAPPMLIAPVPWRPGPGPRTPSSPRARNQTARPNNADQLSITSRRSTLRHPRGSARPRRPRSPR
jgi:hypothetical protein